jgi:hypothetical protein
MKSLNVFVSSLSAPDNYTSPDLVRVVITDQFLEKAKQCVEFMKTNGSHEVLFQCGLEWECYSEAEDGNEAVLEFEGTSYVEFDDEYTTDCCHARVGKYGTVMGTMLVKHTSDVFTFDVGSIEQLEASIADGETDVAA